MLRQAETFRYVADHASDSVDQAEARAIVEHAETFVAAMKKQLTASDGLPRDGRQPENLS
ncbi:MAG: hypothetical protein ABIW85_09800 [Variovorax sp.]